MAKGRDGNDDGDPQETARLDVSWGGKRVVITICKTILTGRDARQVREQTEGLAPARLRDLAVQLAAHPDLTVSVITYDDGTQELEVLHTGPPHRTEHTIDCRKFTRDPGAEQGWTLSIARQSGLHDAVRLIQATLADAAAP
jgi:hypothetical protein